MHIYPKHNCSQQHIDNLRHLAHLLLEINEDKKKRAAFNMRHYCHSNTKGLLMAPIDTPAEMNECGTDACAIGFATTIFPVYAYDTWSEFCDRTFGFSVSDEMHQILFYWLFGPENPDDPFITAIKILYFVKHEAIPMEPIVETPGISIQAYKTLSHSAQRQWAYNVFSLLGI
jgi:hypothetical protein